MNNTAKKFTTNLTTLILTLALFLFGLVLAVVGTFSSPDPTKQAISESGIYETFAGEAVDDAGGTIGGIISYDPEVRNVLIDASTPHLQRDFEKGVDTIFSWVKDPSQTVAFNIEAMAARDDASAAVGSYVVDLINGMPVCSSIPSNFNPNNPFTWDCRPSNINIESYRTAFTSTVANNDFWNEDTFTLDDLAGVTEKEFTEDYEFIPNTYSASVVAAWILAIIALLCIIVNWMAGPTIRDVLRRVGISFIVAGLVLVAIAIIESLVITNLLDGNINSSDEVEAGISSIIKGINGSIVLWWIWTGVIGAILGIAMVVGALLMKKNDKTMSKKSSKTSTKKKVSSPKRKTQKRR